jgi:hypothetical protein
MVPAEDNNDFDIIFHYKYSVLVYIVVGEEHQQRRKKKFSAGNRRLTGTKD